MYLGYNPLQLLCIPLSVETPAGLRSALVLCDALYRLSQGTSETSAHVFCSPDVVRWLTIMAEPPPLELELVAGSFLRCGDDDIAAVARKAVSAAMAIVNAEGCDDLAVEVTFGLSADASPFGKVAEARSAAVAKAGHAIGAKISEVLSKVTVGGARKKAVMQLFSRLHSHAKGLVLSHTVMAAIPLLREYTPVFQPLFPSTFNLHGIHVLEFFGYDPAVAIAISNALAE